MKEYSNNKSSLSYLYVLAFVEGASLMGMEILGGKMIAPFYGTSLYVWSTVLAVTMGGLAIGYFTGGILSLKYPKEKMLLYTLITAGVLVGLTPTLDGIIMRGTYIFSTEIGIIVTGLLMIMPMMICFGIVSPTIIGMLSSSGNEVGNIAGNVYAVSTLGGILATYSIAFYFVLEYGMSSCCWMISFLLLAFTLLGFSRKEFTLKGTKNIKSN
ncbi:MAG: fused MFS/spermidine synthase [Flavobacteriales bacterium]|nr:fused MFS/spermidine synthase [Flavobacteriales bacterium]